MSCFKHHNYDRLDEDVDKENKTPINNGKPINGAVNHALTQPRIRRANDSLDKNVNYAEQQATPCFLPSMIKAKSQSAPGPKALRNVTNLIGESKPSLDVEIESILKDLVREDSPVLKKRHPTNRDECRKKVVKSTEKKAKWSVEQDCMAIAKKLNLTIELADLTDLTTPLMLFRYLEEKGMLSSKVLSYFSGFPLIETLNMSPSYSSCLNDFGLVVDGPFPCSKCTVPLFDQYQNLSVLDLTNVLIGDDELRYIIKLKSLRALGLSGTRITNKGLKYLSKHAEFTSSLQCIKLCYNISVDDSGLVQLANYALLSEIDLWGCDKITMSGCLGLVKSNPKLMKIRLPLAIDERVMELHHFYSGLAKRTHDLVLSVSECLKLDEDELKKQLKYHKDQYSDIFLNISKDCLVKRLSQILGERVDQEKLFCLKM